MKNVIIDGVEYAPVVKETKPKPRTGPIRVGDDLSGVEKYWYAQVDLERVTKYPITSMVDREIESGIAFYDETSAQRYSDRRKLQVRELAAAEASWGSGSKEDEYKYIVLWNRDENATDITFWTDYKYKDAEFASEESAQAFIDSLSVEERELLWS